MPMFKRAPARRKRIPYRMTDFGRVPLTRFERFLWVIGIIRPR